MEKHKQGMIEFWDKKGLNGEELFNKWFKKWSMTYEEQNIEKKRKQSELIEDKKQIYVHMGYSEQQASCFAKVPKETATEVLAMVKAESYVKQTDLAAQKHEEKAKVEADKKQDELIALETAQKKKQEKTEWENLKNWQKLGYEMKLKVQPNLTQSEYLTWVRQQPKATPIEKQEESTSLSP